MKNRILITAIVSICSAIDLSAQSNNIKIDIDKNGVADVFSYDNTHIKVILNGNRWVQKIEKFGYENVVDFKVKNGVFTFSVNCGACTGQYTCTYKLKPVNGNLQFIGYDINYRYAGNNRGYVNKSFNLSTRKYIVSVTEFDVTENKEKAKKEQGVFTLGNLLFSSYTESSFNSLDKYGSSIEPE